jgi:hypothetical protein
VAVSKVTSYDRRSHSRIQTYLVCDIESGQQTNQGTLLNASLGGVLVSSNQGWPVGSSITVTLEIPGAGKTASLHGHIIRVTRGSSKEGVNFQLGIRLNSVTPESMRLVKALASNKVD